PDAIAKSVAYVSGYRVLEEEGLRGLIALIRRELSTSKVTLLVLDGLVAVGDYAGTETEFKKFIHELQVVASLSGCTMFLLTSSGGSAVTPEHTMVDGIVTLSSELAGAQAKRSLEVRKSRGSGAIRGLHAFRITGDGIVIYPRFEALYAHPPTESTWSNDRISSGIPALDAVIDGGLFRGTTTLLLGPSGSGKTSMGLQFLAVKDDQPKVFFGFYETPERLRIKAQRLGLALDRPIDSGQLKIVWQAPTENLLDELAHRLIEAVREQKAARVVVDGLGGFMTAAARPERTSNFFAALSNQLRVMNATTLFTIEAQSLIGSEINMPQTNISSVAENMIVLRLVEWRARLHHTLSIIKMRDSAFDPAMRELLISSKGLSLGSLPKTAEGLMTGTPRSTERSLDEG
ncbi:MAG TPA: ATPase domain-containing protein, partial [Alphaproteobacteria bacterium]|nr:ATPase domain-containing protein [Alphaproteobacteria bacterium]